MKTLTKKLSYLFAFITLFAPTALFAHVKWFLDTDKVISKEHGITPFYYLTSKEVVVWAIISIIIVVLFSIFDRIIPEPKKLQAFGEKHEKGITRVIEIFVGLLFVSITFLWNIILVPELRVTSMSLLFLETLQLISGLMLIFGVFKRYAVGFALILYCFLGYFVGWLPVVENIMLPAILLYIFIKDSPKNSWFKKIDLYSVEIVRIGTAISLIVLAFTEKFMYPELGLSFLSVHHWNFMQLLGMSWFDNRLFVLSAGFSELIFGVIYVFGYLTRINTVVMAGFFAMSVVTMLVQFHKWEMEDLIVYAAAVIFIFYGYGKTRFFHRMPEESFWRRIHLGKLFNLK